MTYLLKVKDLLKSKKDNEEKSKSQPEETIAERVKLRRQKVDNKDLFDTSSPFTDENNDDSDEFIDIQDMPPLESDEEEVKEGKGLKI